jgi:hypothetical protein
MKIYPPDKTTGLYELASPRQANSRWYVRTLQYTASYDNKNILGYYQYLHSDLKLYTKTYNNKDIELYYNNEKEALDAIRRYKLTSKLLIKQKDVYIPTEKFTLLMPKKEDNSYRVYIKSKRALYYLQEDLTFHPKLCIFKTYQAALFAKLRYERLYQKDFQ